MNPPLLLLLLPSNRSLAASRHGTSTHGLTRATCQLCCGRTHRRRVEMTKRRPASLPLVQYPNNRPAERHRHRYTRREQSLQSETAAQQVGRLQVVVLFESSLPPSFSLTSVCRHHPVNHVTCSNHKTAQQSFKH